MTSGLARQPDRKLVVTALGVVQILAWGTSFYFPAVFAGPIVAETGWSLSYVVSGTSIGLLVAGLVSPWVGRIIGARGGRPVLLASSLLYAVGLCAIALASSLPIYFAAWVVLGLGMGTGLYDAVFTTLGRIYGHAARSPITNLTLFGGFASAVCWPLSAFMIEQVGWRTACLIYAGLHLLVALPLQAAVVRGEKARSDAVPAAVAALPDAPPLRHEGVVFAMLALVQSICFGIGSIVVVHMLVFLQARGVDFAAAVALGTLFGPAQVAARLIERIFGHTYHPVWTMAAACAGMAIGLVLLDVGLSLLPLVLIIYGAGYGISWVARGTLPLALFGPTRFPRLMGKLAFPSLIAQALSPSLGAWLIERNGVDATIGYLTLFALINVLLIVLLWAVSRPRVAV